MRHGHRVLGVLSVILLLPALAFSATELELQYTLSCEDLASRTLHVNLRIVG
jgi:hypothetical protein